jgi:uncharacterized protein (TIGR02246 family)
MANMTKNKVVTGLIGQSLFALKFFFVLSTLVIIFNLMFSMNPVKAQSGSQQNIRSLIEQARNAWVIRDVDALTELFTLDGELIVPGQRSKGRARIREQIANFAQQYTDVNITIQRIVIDGNQAAVEWHYEDTEKSTGKRNQADDAIILEVKDGQICYWREYFDIYSSAQPY